MPYYFFNKCSITSIDKLAQLCEHTGLKKVISLALVKEWHALSYDEPVLLVNYRQFREYPLLVQTNPKVRYEDPVIVEMIKEILSISDATHIYEGIFTKRELNMSKFR